MTRSVGEIDNICRKSSYKIDKSHGATYMITSVKLFGMEKVSGITKKNVKIGTLGDFEKMYDLYVAMAEKPLSSGQKWFLR